MWSVSRNTAGPEGLVAAHALEDTRAVVETVEPTWTVASSQSTSCPFIQIEAVGSMPSSLSRRSGRWSEVERRGVIGHVGLRRSVRAAVALVGLTLRKLDRSGSRYSTEQCPGDARCS